MLNCIGRWIFWHLTLSGLSHGRLYALLHPLWEWFWRDGGIYERWGGSLVLSPLPVMVQRGVYLTIMLMLWIPLLPFLIFPSSCPRSASPAYIPSASSPPWPHRVIMGSSSNLADHLHFWLNYYLHIEHIFIFITIIASVSIVVNIFHIIPQTSENMLYWWLPLKKR